MRKYPKKKTDKRTKRKLRVPASPEYPRILVKLKEWEELTFACPHCHRRAFAVLGLSDLE